MIAVYNVEQNQNVEFILCYRDNDESKTWTLQKN